MVAPDDCLEDAPEKMSAGPAIPARRAQRPARPLAAGGPPSSLMVQQIQGLADFDLSCLILFCLLLPGNSKEGVLIIERTSAHEIMYFGSGSC